VRLLFLALLLALIPAAAGAATPSAERPRLSVTVHVEDGGAIVEPVLNAAVAIAKEIWRPYVDLAFGRVGDSLPIGVDALALVITGRLSNGEGTGLGWIDFEDGLPSRTISISATAVARLMVRSSWAGHPLDGWPPAVRAQFMTRAIGRSIAHEMGHYLLQSKTHTAKGLMRSLLTPDDIMTGGVSGDRLDAGQTAILSQRMLELARASRDQGQTRPTS